MEDFEKRQIELAKGGAEQEFHSNVIFEDRDVNGSGEVTFDISNVSFDAHRSIVNVRNIDYKSRYEKNPIVLFNHDYDKPVGRSMWVKFPNPEKTILRAGMKFTDATQTAKDVRALVSDNILRGASIGFIPKGSKFDDEAKKAFEADYSDLGLKAPDALEWYIPQCELCEWSIVSVPSNVDTLKNKLGDLDPYLRLTISSEMFQEKITELEKSMGLLSETLSARYLALLEELEKEKTERKEERKQLIEIFKDALKARDVKRKPETLGAQETERAIRAMQNYINKKRGIF